MTYIQGSGSQHIQVGGKVLKGVQPENTALNTPGAKVVDNTIAGGQGLLAAGADAAAAQGAALVNFGASKDAPTLSESTLKGLGAFDGSLNADNSALLASIWAEA